MRQNIINSNSAVYDSNEFRTPFADTISVVQQTKFVGYLLTVKNNER